MYTKAGAFNVAEHDYMMVGYILLKYNTAINR